MSDINHDRIASILGSTYKKAKCGHPAYRDHDDLCIEDGCPHAAYRPLHPTITESQTAVAERDAARAALKRIVKELYAVTIDEWSGLLEAVAEAERVLGTTGVKG